MGDSAGVLHVSAEDKGTGKFETETVTNDKGRLTEEQIEQMIKDSELFADKDKNEITTLRKNGTMQIDKSNAGVVVGVVYESVEAHADKWSDEGGEVDDDTD